MQFKGTGKLFEEGEIWAVLNGGGPKSANFKTASSISDMQNITASMFNKQFRIGSDGISEWSKAQIEAKSSSMGLTTALTNELVALSNDADFTAKARAGKITWGQALKDTTIKTEDLGDALLSSNKVSN